jgi:hypothetical protein
MLRWFPTWPDMAFQNQASGCKFIRATWKQNLSVGMNREVVKMVDCGAQSSTIVGESHWWPCVIKGNRRCVKVIEYCHILSKVSALDQM